MQTSTAVSYRPRRQRRSSTEIDECVAASARSIFARKGYGETTLREIADLAEVHEPALYRRYPSKAALFQAAILEPLQAHIEGYIAAVQQASNSSHLSPEDRVRKFMPPLYELMVSERQSILALLSAGEFHPEEFPQSRNFLALVSQLVEAVVPHVELELNARAALFSAFGLALGIGLLSGGPNMEDGHYLADRQSVIDELVNFTLCGVGGRGGEMQGSHILPSNLAYLLDRVADAEKRAIRAELELELLKGLRPASE